LVVTFQMKYKGDCECWVDENLEREANKAWFKLISRNSPAETEGNHRSLSQTGWPSFEIDTTWKIYV
jgi:hypothetical protein